MTQTKLVDPVSISCQLGTGIVSSLSVALLLACSEVRQDLVSYKLHFAFLQGANYSGFFLAHIMLRGEETSH